MQDTARHDPRSPCRIPDAPCKVSRAVSSGTARYVIGSRMSDSLHDGAVPVGRIVRPAWPAYAACCISMREVRVRTFFTERRRGYLSPLPSHPSHFYSSSLCFSLRLVLGPLFSRFLSSLVSSLPRNNYEWKRVGKRRSVNRALSGVKKYPDPARRTLSIHSRFS